MSTAPRVPSAKRDWGHDETGCTVLHIDMDAFYASLEIARNPRLAELPVIIGTGPRAVVSAANYKARAYGINSAMSSAHARRLCPHGVFLPVDMAHYRMMSRRIFTEVFERITDLIEQVSVDECYMDVSAALLRWKRPSTIGAWIREQVAHRYSITCSVGIASNKLVAKMASTNAKPDGMLLIPRSQHRAFVQLMPLRSLPGIGPALERRLNAWGIASVAELARTDEDALIQATGSAAVARTLLLASRGADTRKVTPHTPEKSIGAERTFTQDTRDMRQVCDLLRHCCDDVASTLRRRALTARTITVKLRYDDLRYATKAVTLPTAHDTASALYPVAIDLLRAMLRVQETALPHALPRAIRLAGISASGLHSSPGTSFQPSLDDHLDDPRDNRARNAEQALDAIRRKYGKHAASMGV